MSSNTPYIDQDTRDEIQRAADSGIDHAVIAGQIGITVEELCRLMGWPQWQEIPTGNMVDQPADYLWSVEKLDGVL